MRPNQFVKEVLPNRFVRTDRAVCKTASIGTAATVVQDDALLREGTATVVRVAAIVAGEHALQERRRHRAPLGEALVLCQALLSQLEGGFIDQGWNGNLDPFLMWPIAPIHSSNRALTLEASGTGEFDSGDAFGLSEGGFSVVRRIAQHSPNCGTSPKGRASAGRYALLDKHPCQGPQAQALVGIQVKNAPHHFRLVRADFIVGIGIVCLLYVVVAVWRARQYVDASEFAVMALAATCPLSDIRAVVLGDHALYLQKQFSFGRMVLRSVDELHLYA